MVEKKVRTPRQTRAKENIYALNILNYIGSALVFFGIAYCIVINWNDLNHLSQLGATLGAAIVTFIAGISLDIRKKNAPSSSAFFLISAFLLPIGLDVILDIANIAWSSNAANAWIAAIGFSLFAYTYLRLKQIVLLIITFLFASLFFIAIVNFFASLTSFAFENLTQYELILLGLSYLYLGYRLRISSYSFLMNPLYFLGCLFSLSGAYFLGPTSFNTPYFIYWKIVSTLFILLTFIAAVRLKNKVFLYLGAIFFLCYMLAISRYFTSVLGNYGWPLFLVGTGLFLILASNVLMYISKK
jgi:hypothetical protein